MYGGRTAQEINARIKDIPASTITVVAGGTNNIEFQPLSRCKTEIKYLIDNVSRKRDTVIMSLIPYRHDKPHLSVRAHE